MLDVNQPIVTERIHSRGADKRAVLDCAFGFADLVIYCNMAFGINLECIAAELGFHIDRHLTPLAVPGHPGQRPGCQNPSLPLA